jgi:peroxiredoxin
MISDTSRRRGFEFDAAVANGDTEAFSRAEQLGDGPVVLAFFAGAFTPPCSDKMVALEEHSDAVADAGATVYESSADSAFSLNACRAEYTLWFALVSDMAREATGAYDLEIDIADFGLFGVANRAVFVLDGPGPVSYAWTTDDPTVDPDYNELVEAVTAVPSAWDQPPVVLRRWTEPKARYMSRLYKSQ